MAATSQSQYSMTARQVCEYFNASREWLRLRILQSGFPQPVRLGSDGPSGHRRWSLAAIMAWEQSRLHANDNAVQAVAPASNTKRPQVPTSAKTVEAAPVEVEQASTSADLDDAHAIAMEAWRAARPKTPSWTSGSPIEAKPVNAKRKRAPKAAPVEVETRPAMPDDCNTHEQEVAHHVAVIRWEQAHPEIVAAEEAVANAEREAKRNAEKAVEDAERAKAMAMERPVEPVCPDDMPDDADGDHPHWVAMREYREAFDLWRTYHPDELRAEKKAKEAAQLVEARKLVALAATKEWRKANPHPHQKWELREATKRVKEADQLAALRARPAAELPGREAEEAANDAKEAAEIEAAKGAPRPKTPTVAAWFKMSEEKQEAYLAAIETWNQANRDPALVAAEAALEEAGEPNHPEDGEDYSDYWVRRDKWNTEHADLVAAEKAALDAWTARDCPWEAEEKKREQAEQAAKDAKRIKREAKDPEAVKAKSLEDAQADEIENSGEVEDAKQDARESGEAWGDIKDQWKEDWLADNWTPELEAAWLVEFEDKWLKDHGAAFPGHVS